MRFELQFTVKKNEFPLDYRSIFISFLKSCISTCNDGKYINNYFEPARVKEYSFAIFFSKPEFLEDKIILKSDKLKMVFSTLDIKTGFIFMSAFLENKYKCFQLKSNNEMKLIDIRQKKEQDITSNEALFQIASPLCIRRHNRETNQDFYYSYEHHLFEKEALQIIRFQLEKAGFLPEYWESLKIEPIRCKKVIVKHYGCNIECTLGKIMLKGNPVILQYFQKAGIGSRKSAGFGLLELISQG